MIYIARRQDCLVGFLSECGCQNSSNAGRTVTVNTNAKATPIAEVIPNVTN